MFRLKDINDNLITTNDKQVVKLVNSDVKDIPIRKLNDRNESFI